MWTIISHSCASERLMRCCIALWMTQAVAMSSSSPPIRPQHQVNLRTVYYWNMLHWIRKTASFSSAFDGEEGISKCWRHAIGLSVYARVFLSVSACGLCVSACLYAGVVWFVLIRINEQWNRIREMQFHRLNCVLGQLPNENLDSMTKLLKKIATSKDSR